MTSYSKNIATDFGWTVGSDASLAWDSFETWRTANMVAGDSVTLTGALATYTFARSGGGSGKKLAPGMLGGITIIHDFPAGTIFSDGGTGGSGFFLGGTGMYDDDVHSSRINTVLAGHNTVTLKTSGEISRFTTGQYVIVTGCCQQIGGSPINPAFFDLLKITNITGAVITLDGAITHDLLDTWPLFFAGDGGTPDDGGPATIYALHADFDVNAYYNGITFDEDYQIYGNGKFLQFNNCGCTPSRGGIIPSLNKRMNFISFTGPTSSEIEVDKLVEELLYLNCNMHSLKFQSAGSVKRCTIIDSTVYNVNGTPSELIMLRSTMGTADGGINIGALAHGATKLIRADNCALPLIIQVGVSEADIVGQGFTMTSGVIRWDPANSDNPSWCTPGSNLHIVGTGAHAPLDCTVTSLVRESSTVIAAHTTATGGFPGTDSTLTLRVHPCPVHAGTGNTGAGSDSVGFNDNQGDPLFFDLETPNSYIEFGGGGGGSSGSAGLRQANVFGLADPSDPSTYYTGVGNPAVSTADYYHLDGLEWLRPYDLLTMGTTGASIAASKGRYFWPATPDHPAGGNGWTDAQDFMGGFSSDPGVLPDRLDRLFGPAGSQSWNNNILLGGVEVWSIYHAQFIKYMPGDSAGKPFYIYAEGATVGGAGTRDGGEPRQHEEGSAKSADLVTWTMVGPTHPNNNFSNWSSFQAVEDDGSGGFVSVGLKSFFTPNVFGNGKWTSSDGLTFTPATVMANPFVPPNTTGTPGAYPSTETPSSTMNFSATALSTTVGGQGYRYCVQDSRNADGGMYVARVPVDANYNALASPTTVRISAKYDGIYPGPTFLQAVSAYVEDGVAHLYAQVAFPPSSSNQGMMNGAVYRPSATAVGSSSGSVLTITALTRGTIVLPVRVLQLSAAGHTQVLMTSQISGTALGAGTYQLDITPDNTLSAGTHLDLIYGGLWQQFIDYYTEVIDSTAAAQAAPIGVRATCNAGTVTIAWYDALPSNTYRVYRGTSASTQTTLIGDVSGTSTTDAPTAGAQYWYKVVTLEGSTERQNRVVHCYASAASTLINKHINRVIDDGGDASKIDATWLGALESYFSSNSLTSALQFWADPACGVKQSGGVVIKEYCLGTTRLPRGGDYTPVTGSGSGGVEGTSTSTYSATGMNGTVPGLTNPNATSFGYFGGNRINNIRRYTQITLVAVYKKPGTAKTTLLAMNQFGGMALYHDAGSPGVMTFELHDGTTLHTAFGPTIASATAANIAIAVFDGSNMIVYVNGTAGTPVSGFPANTDLAISTCLRGQWGDVSDVPFLGSGSLNSRYDYGIGHLFSDNQALFTHSSLGVLNKALTSTQVGTLTTLIRTRIGA